MSLSSYIYYMIWRGLALSGLYGCCKHLGVPALRLVPRLFCLFPKLIRRWDGSRRHSEYTAYRAPVQGLAGNSGYPFNST